MPCMKKRRKVYDKGLWAVTRERFQIADAEPPNKFVEALPLETLIPIALDRLKLDTHKKLTALAGIWPEIVGPQLAPNTRPGQLENGCLTIFVSHPAWIFELRGAPQNEILTRLQTRCGANEIQRLRFAVDPAPPAP